MNAVELFELWAPRSGAAASEWSAWAKPVLFAALRYGLPARPAGEPPGQPAVFDASSVPDASARMAIVVDLPGAASVAAGLALAERGYRPVPLFNACAPPAPGATAAVDVRRIQEALVSGAERLAGLALASDAPPAFLLDADRLAGGSSPGPGTFDNRWLVLPQDFPSANRLLARGITRALLVQEGRRDPRDDLAHVLLRWQQSGVAIAGKETRNGPAPEPLTVHRPSRFKALWYAAFAVLGFRRSAAGGFGGIVPHPSSG